MRQLLKLTTVPEDMLSGLKIRKEVIYGLEWHFVIGMMLSTSVSSSKITQTEKKCNLIVKLGTPIQMP